MDILFKMSLGLWMSLVLVGAFWYAPTAAGLKELSRIIYFHVPSAWVAVLAYGVAMVQGIYYLRHRDLRSDAKACAAVELGTLFALLATVTGALFARETWGVYWNWDPRQTTIVVLFFIYVAYFSFRGTLEDAHRRARLSAVYVVFAFSVVPFLVFILPRAYVTLHPSPLLNTGGRVDMNPQMLLVFLAALAGFTGVFVWMHNLRWRTEVLLGGGDGDGE